MTTVKRLVCLCIAFFCLQVPLSAFAQPQTFAAQGLTLTLPSGFTVLSTASAASNAALLKELGYTEQAFQAYLSDGNYLFVAVDGENQRQFKVAVWETEFSKQTNDLSKRDASEQDALGGAMWTGQDFERVFANGMPFYALSKQEKDSGGVYATVQYVTIKNGAYYSLSYSVSGEMDPVEKQAATDVLESIQISNKTDINGWSVMHIVTVVILTVAILAAAILVVFLLVSLLRDLTGRQKEENDVREFITIKRRRF